MITKKFVNSRQVSKVTFRVDFAKQAQEVELAGDFNDWHPQAMKRLKTGEYKLNLNLTPGQSYQYRYRIDGKWENDWAADRYIANGMGSDNSVVDC